MITEGSYVCAKIIEEELKKAGYKVEIKGNIIGESGVSHTFDIIAKKKRVLCFNIVKEYLLKAL